MPPFKEIKSRADVAEFASEPTPTGFSRLDDVLRGGMQAGSLVVPEVSGDISDRSRGESLSWLCAGQEPPRSEAEAEPLGAAQLVPRETMIKFFEELRRRGLMLERGKSGGTWRNNVVPSYAVKV